MRRLVLLLLALATVVPVTPARADVLIDAGVYVNGQATGWCEDFSGHYPDGGATECRFLFPGFHPKTAQIVMSDATFLVARPLRGYLSFVVGTTRTAPVSFCGTQTLPVPAGATMAMVRVATVTDLAANDPCSFGTTGLVQAIFED